MAAQGARCCDRPEATVPGTLVPGDGACSLCVLRTMPESMMGSAGFFFFFFLLLLLTSTHPSTRWTQMGPMCGGIGPARRAVLQKEEEEGERMGWIRSARGWTGQIPTPSIRLTTNRSGVGRDRDRAREGWRRGGVTFMETEPQEAKHFFVRGAFQVSGAR